MMTRNQTPDLENKIEHQKSKARLFFNFVIFILFVVIVYLFVSKHPDYIEKIQQISLSTILTLILLQIVAHIIRTKRLQLLTKHYEVDLKFKESLALSYANSLLSIIPLQVGLIYKGLFLKQRFHLPYRRFTLITAMGYLISLITGLFISSLLLAAYWFLGKPLNGLFFLFMVVLFISLNSFIFFPFFRNFLKLVPYKKMHVILEEWETLRKDRKLIIALVLNDFLIIGISALRLFIVFLNIQIFATFFDCVLIFSTAQLSGLFALSSGTLGLKETFSGIIAACINLPIGYSIMAATIDRVVIFIPHFVFGFAGIMYLSHITKSNLDFLKENQKE